MPTTEHERLREITTFGVPPWRRWGPYVSERAWGTVREDYSADGSAWTHLPHDLARSKAYRWGEDGLAGICDRFQLLVFALALWNTRDPFLKERAFGLSGPEGNHGEDVKEYYFYLDNVPTHSYMKYLYKYPQAEFPYQQLVDENRRREGRGVEYELLDTGVFDEDRYFDVFVEYAKAAPEDICIRIEAFNRGPEAADLHLLPHLWFRNTWAWRDPRDPEPIITPGSSGPGFCSLLADDSSEEPMRNLPFPYRLGPWHLYAEGTPDLLFTNNETNMARVYPWASNVTPYVKDAFHRFLVNGEPCVNPNRIGTKACVHYVERIPAGGSVVVRLRLTPDPLDAPLADVDGIVTRRRAEADEFYAAIHPPHATEDERRVQRQAFASLLWNKQIYLFDVNRWLEGDNPDSPPPESRWSIRNIRWRHLNSMRIMSMPDKWEYPWFAAWDLAFHCIPLAIIDPDFAQEQLWMLLFEQFQHPNGQIPAYEWEFSDLNPPVHAWACWKVYTIDKERHGRADRKFLERCFHKLLINFAWWVNKVDRQGNNVFEGGFLGLDNITVMDRSEELPGGAVLEQSDATGWMGLFCLNLMRITLELAEENRVYEGLATKFFQHYIYIGAAMKRMGGRNYQLWDEADGFFYDVLRFPDGDFQKFRVRSLVGLIPMYAIDVLHDASLATHQEFLSNLDWFIRNRQDLVRRCCYTDEQDGTRRHILAIVDRDQLRSLLERVWDPNEFLSEVGVRSLSKYHERRPFVFGTREVRYEPAEAETKIKGGNSNWRGPIWFPTSYLLIDALTKFGEAFGSGYTIQTPGNPDGPVTPKDMAREIANRLIRLFVRDASGRRPIYGESTKFQYDPHWRDYILFFEYFHGDHGAGLGASHQTGWTALVASLIDEWRR
ncbi:MAG: glucosidase [Candidatus Latescibacteria bacterium]|nr:glucosidase [Candidatus Latescibacterota bacterium]